MQYLFLLVLIIGVHYLVIVGWILLACLIGCSRD